MHVADLYYLFDTPGSAEFLFLPGVAKTPEDEYLVELFGIAWTNFAKTGYLVLFSIQRFKVLCK